MTNIFSNPQNYIDDYGALGGIDMMELTGMVMVGEREYDTMINRKKHIRKILFEKGEN